MTTITHSQPKWHWSIRDNGLFCTMFARMKINVCGLCASVNHVSDFCPLLVNRNLKKQNPENIGYNKPQIISCTNGNAKKEPLFEGRQLCINFNERSCQRPACKFLHLCFDCYSPHPKQNVQPKHMTMEKIKSKGKDRKPQEKSEKSNQ